MSDSRDWLLLEEADGWPDAVCRVVGMIVVIVVAARITPFLLVMPGSVLYSVRCGLFDGVRRALSVSTRNACHFRRRSGFSGGMIRSYMRQKASRLSSPNSGFRSPLVLKNGA